MKKARKSGQKTNGTAKNVFTRRKFRLSRLILPAAVVLVLAAVVLLAVLLEGGGDGEPSGSGDSSSTQPSSSETTAATETESEAEESGAWVIEGENAYYQDSSGEFYTGAHTIDGTEYVFSDDGALQDGWVTVDNIRYHFAGGVLSKGTVVIDGITRYINADGTMFVGWYDNPNTGNRYYYDFETGASYKGWQEIDGKTYYFRADGTMARNEMVDGIALGADGAAAGDPGNTTTPPSTTAPPSTRPPVQPDPTVSAELGAELDNILATYGSSPRNIYDYVHDHFTYKWAAEGSIAENAQHMLDYGTGSCYNFASLTYLLFRRAGYDAYYVTGKGWQPGDYHCWVLAYFDGGWYYVDSLYVRSAKLTAEQLEAKGYEWDKSAYPS